MAVLTETALLNLCIVREMMFVKKSLIIVFAKIACQCGFDKGANGRIRTRYALSL